MDSITFIKDKRAFIKPLRTRLEAKRKEKPQKNPSKNSRSLAGVVNYLSMFGPKFTKIS